MATRVAADALDLGGRRGRRLRQRLEAEALKVGG